MSTWINMRRRVAYPSQHGRPNRAGEVFALVSEFSDLRSNAYKKECVASVPGRLVATPWQRKRRMCLKRRKPPHTGCLLMLFNIP
jgi:hypothetical protein